MGQYLKTLLVSRLCDYLDAQPGGLSGDGDGGTPVAAIAP